MNTNIAKSGGSSQSLLIDERRARSAQSGQKNKNNLISYWPASLARPLFFLGVE